MIGIMQHNRSGIPKEIKSVENPENLSCRVYLTPNNINLSAYVVKIKSGRKNVLLLSTVRPLMGMTKDDEKKNLAKGGTDEGRGIFCEA